MFKYYTTMKYFLLVVIATVIRSSLCANILFVNDLLSPSHHIWNEAIAEGLVKRGHNVTFLSHDAPKFTAENYTVMKIEGIYELFTNFDVITCAHMGPVELMTELWNFNNIACDLDIKSEALQALLKYPRNKFDLIIFDLNAGQCLYPLIEKFGNPPVIGTTPFGLPAYISEAMGHQIFPYIPYGTLTYTDRMTFLQRFESVLLHNIVNLIRHYFYMPRAFAIASKVFGQNIRSFDEVERNVTLLLTNLDPVLDYVQPLPPNIVPVGGLHAKPAKRLPSDLQNIMDNAQNGIIYFSLGSNVKPENIPHKHRQALMDAFARLPYTVLAKFDATNLTVSKNVVLKKWLPQNDILGHKNLKIFITHGGSLSIQEALYHGVPVVGMPVFIDQQHNMEKIVSKGVGKQLNFFNITSEEVYQTVTEIITNPKYRNNMQVLSKKFHDQPQTPIERAMFWIEYVLRNANVHHLNTAARDMHFYEILGLDIFLSFTFLTTLVALILYKVCKLIVKTIEKKCRKKIKRQ